MLQSMGSQRVRYDSATEQQQARLVKNWRLNKLIMYKLLRIVPDIHYYYATNFIVSTTDGNTF